MSKYAQQAKATKKKRTISSLGQAMKKAGKLSPKRSAQLATRQSEMRRQGKKKMMQTAMTAAQKGKTPRKKKPLTASEREEFLFLIENKFLPYQFYHCKFKTEVSFGLENLQQAFKANTRLTSFDLRILAVGLTCQSHFGLAEHLKC